MKHLGDEDPAVRRAVMLAIGHINAPAAAENLVDVLNESSNAADVRDGLVRAIEDTGKPGIERLLAMAESGRGQGTRLVCRRGVHHDADTPRIQRCCKTHETNI